MKTWIKAGLVGAGLEILCTIPVVLFYILPPTLGTLITCCFSILFFAVLPTVGVLTTLWLPKPTTNNEVIKQSAFSGLLSSIIDAIFTLILVAILHFTGLTMEYIENTLSSYGQITPSEDLMLLLSLPVQLISTSVCLVGNIIISVLLSIVGAVITYSIIQRKSGNSKEIN